MTHLSKYSRTTNYLDQDADNLTIGDQHYTQPTNRRAELWASYHEAQRKNQEWFKGIGTQQVPVRAIEAHADLELLKHGE